MSFISLENLSTPALEALLAFHVEAARNIEERLRCAEESLRSTEEGLRSTLPLAEQNGDIEVSLEDAENALLPEHSALQSPFNLLHRQSAAPSPSPPSTPVRNTRQMPSTPSLGGAWLAWSTDTTPPTPTPPHSTVSRKRRRVEDENPGEREHVRIRIDPGWPRGFIRTPPRKQRVWDKENEKRVTSTR
ncbi:hypothetical protein B0H19DRAFT_1065206 [Mycena capillaripes]|nr:hypothetical protein B0H19DRAFT_1065206 [Mycena capillaripes]